MISESEALEIAKNLGYRYNQAYRLRKFRDHSAAYGAGAVRLTTNYWQPHQAEQSFPTANPEALGNPIFIGNYWFKIWWQIAGVANWNVRVQAHSVYTNPAGGNISNSPNVLFHSSDVFAPSALSFGGMEFPLFFVANAFSFRIQTDIAGAIEFELYQNFDGWQIST